MVSRLIPRRFVSIQSAAAIRTIDDIPGPKAYPFVGTVPNYLPGIGKYDPNRAHKNAAQWYREFGPVVKDQPFSHTIVFLFDPRDIQNLLQSVSPKWPLRDSHNPLKYVRNNVLNLENGGLFSENNEVWGNLRSLFQKEFSLGEGSKYIKRLDELASSTADKLLDETMKPHVEENFMKVIQAHATGIAWNVIFGNKWNIASELNNENSRSIKMASSMISLNEELHKAEFGSGLWEKISVPVYQKIKQRVIEAHRYGEELLNIRIRNGILKPKYDDVMLDNWIRDGKASPDEIVTFLVDAFLAATDTTTYTTSFVFYLLSTDDRVQNKLFEELRQLSPDPATPLTVDRLMKATYLKKVVKEALRLFPVSIGFNRILTDDTKIGGYFLPKGTDIVTCNQIISRMPEWVEQPDDFIPERYDAESGFKKIHPYVSLPFGHGARMCIARRFAELSVYTLLFKVFRKYHFKWNSPQTMDCLSRQLNQPDIPLKFAITRREN